MRWNTGAPSAALLVDDLGPAWLFLRAYPDDPDQRDVVLTWTLHAAVRMEDPNDEALSGHRLYDRGLAAVLWVGEVFESALVQDLENRNRVDPRHDADRFKSLRHWVVPLKECVVEVVADSLTVSRTDRAAANRA